MARPGRLTPREAMTSCFILATRPHPVAATATTVATLGPSAGSHQVGHQPGYLVGDFEAKVTEDGECD